MEEGGYGHHKRVDRQRQCAMGVGKGGGEGGDLKRVREYSGGKCKSKGPEGGLVGSCTDNYINENVNYSACCGLYVLPGRGGILFFVSS